MNTLDSKSSGGNCRTVGASIRRHSVEIVAASERDPLAWLVIKIPLDLSDPVDRETLETATSRLAQLERGTK